MNLFLLGIITLIVKIINVALGTIRTIISVKGKNLIASVVGFIEVFIWFMIVKEALNTPEKSIWIAICYSLGSAIGTYLGGIISKKFIKTNLNVQIITEKAYPTMVNLLREKGYGVTVINVEGKNNEKNKYMLFMEIKNKNYFKLKETIKAIDKDAFIVVNETKYIVNGFIN